MAKHSLGGLRSLTTLRAPDRTIMRLSPIQTWIMEQVLGNLEGWHSLPPATSLIRAATRLVHRGMVYMHRDGTKVRYRLLTSVSAETAERYVSGELAIHTGSKPAHGRRSGYRVLE